MLHGRVVRPPEVGATLVGVDEASVRDMPGFVKVVVKKNFVGVVAQKPWQATQIAAKLKAEWTKGVGPAGAARLLRIPPQPETRYATRSSSTRRTWTTSWPGPRGWSRRRITTPYQMHGSIGTSCAVADVQGDTGDDLVADAVRVSDAQHRRDAARLKPENVHVDLHDGVGLLRPERRRHRVVRRRADVAGRRQACSRAVVAPGRDGVGELRHGVRHRPARGARRGAAASSPGITRRGRRRSAAGRATTTPAT